MRFCSEFQRFCSEFQRFCSEFQRFCSEFRVPKILFRVPEILLRVPEILFRVQSSKDFVQSSRDFVQSSRQESSGAPHKLIQEEINFAQYKLNKVTQIYISLVVVHTIFVLLDLLRHLVRSNNFDGCDYPM